MFLYVEKSKNHTHTHSAKLQDKKINTQKSGASLYSNSEWYGEGGGRRVQDGEHMYTCGGFILIFGKTNTIM